MRQLDHPNIVKLIDFSESRQYYYIVLELCPGGELFHQIVRLTYFSEDLSRHVIVQVAKALDYIHEQKGVVHRFVHLLRHYSCETGLTCASNYSDIKPENLLFYPIPLIPTRNPKPRSAEDEDKADEGEFVPGVGSGGIGQIKIADFGLSKVVWDSQTMTPCGTVGYTAPEIVKDERYSKSVDMWALGCVLYTLLCGFPPFYDESIQVLTEKVAKGSYTFLSPWWDDISKSAQDLVTHLLTVNPDQRYTIGEFLNHPWIRNTTDVTTAATDAPPLATPAIQRGHQVGHPVDAETPALAFNPALLETPGARRQDFRSPGAVNLREVFDVGYAVHRQEEEAKRRKNFKQGYRGAAGISGLNPLNEDDDDENDDDVYGEDEGNTDDTMYGRHGQSAIPAKLSKGADADVHQMEQRLLNTNIGGQSSAAQARQQQQQFPPPPPPTQRGYGQHSAAVAAAAKQVRKKRGPFELSLDNATLLGRRGMKANGGLAGSNLRSELIMR